MASQLGKKGRNVISNWVNGKAKPSADDLVLLAEALETTTDYLLRGVIENKTDLEAILRENALQRATIEAQQETIKALKKIEETKNIEVISQ